MLQRLHRPVFLLLEIDDTGLLDDRRSVGRKGFQRGQLLDIPGMRGAVIDKQRPHRLVIQPQAKRRKGADPLTLPKNILARQNQLDAIPVLAGTDIVHDQHRSRALAE